MKPFIHFVFWMLLLTVPSSILIAESNLIPTKLVLRADDKLGIIYSHSLKKNQTIYGLSKFFNTNIDRISAANPGINMGAIKLDQHINIPINTDMISSERNLSPNKSYIPVFYTVKAKDNLFRVAKVYFNQSIENVMNINKLESMELSIGQKLLVGWYQYNPVYKERLAWTEKGIEVDASAKFRSELDNKADSEILVQTADQDKLVFQKVISQRKENRTNSGQDNVVSTVDKPERRLDSDLNMDSQTASHELNEEVVLTNDISGETEVEVLLENRELSTDPFENRNGLFVGDYDGKPTINSAKLRAQWNSKSKDKTNLFALHATAKINSYIEIYNPMLDRMVIAKVVGNIPPKAYKKNVDLIVSPKVAETLGAKDKKFFVSVRFIN